MYKKQMKTNSNDRIRKMLFKINKNA